MRLAHVGIFALTLSCGCLRFGYEPVSTSSEPKADAAPRDAGSDKTTTDAAALSDASSDRDAGGRGAGTTDAGVDAGSKDAGRPPVDSGVDAATATDAATADASSADAALEDAAMMDAAVDDAAVADAAVDAGSTDPCLGRSDLLYCDSFEDPAFDGWYPVATNGELDHWTDPDRVRSGSGSLRAATFDSTNANSYARYGKRVFDHQKTGDVWARAYYYLPSSTTIDTFFSTLLVTEVEMPYLGCSLLIRPTRLELGGFTTRFYTLSPFPRDKWACVELHIKIDASAGLCEAYVDGSVAVQSQMGNTVPGMGYTSLEVGIHYTEPSQGPVEVFVDDVAAGTERVGCD